MSVPSTSPSGGPGGSPSRTPIASFRRERLGEIEFDREISESRGGTGRTSRPGAGGRWAGERGYGEPVRPGLLAPEAAGARLRPRDADAGPDPRRAHHGQDARELRGSRTSWPERPRRVGPSSPSATTCGSWPSASVAWWSCGPGEWRWMARRSAVFAEAAWPELRASYLEPPLPAVAGARSGSEPRPPGAVVAALAAGPRNR